MKVEISLQIPKEFIKYGKESGYTDPVITKAFKRFIKKIIQDNTRTDVSFDEDTFEAIFEQYD